MTQRVLDDYTTAPIDERLRAMLAYLEKTTLDPDSLTADDARALRNENISNDAAVEALYVCFLFNVYDRLADTLGVGGPTGGIHPASGADDVEARLQVGAAAPGF